MLHWSVDEGGGARIWTQPHASWRRHFGFMLSNALTHKTQTKVERFGAAYASMMLARSHSPSRVPSTYSLLVVLGCWSGRHCAR